MGVDPAMPVVQSVDLPPLRRMPCCQNPCFRCENRRGGFQFPFIGIWTRRAVLSRRGATPAETWQLAQSDNAALDLVAATMHSFGLEAEDFVPAHVERLSRRLALPGWHQPGLHVQPNGACGGSAKHENLPSSWRPSATHAPMQDDCCGPCWVQWRQRWSWRAECLVSWSGRDARLTGMQCRGGLEFCLMCGSSDEELNSDEDEHSGGVCRQRYCLATEL